MSEQVKPPSRQVAYALPVDACYHCGRRDEPDGDHTCLCPKRDGECPEHDPIYTFEEYQRRYLPSAYETARLSALTPEQAVRYAVRQAIQDISDDLLADDMAARHRAVHEVARGFGPPGCRRGWGTCPDLRATLTEAQLRAVDAFGQPTQNASSEWEG